MQYWVKKDGTKISGRVLTSCENIQSITENNEDRKAENKGGKTKTKGREKERSAIIKAERGTSIIMLI